MVCYALRSGMQEKEIWIPEERLGWKMSIWEMLLLAVGLSMDAFAVSVCKGLSVQRFRWSDSIIAGLYFGGFQALMPLIGYFLGRRFSSLITDFDHWIAFVLLVIIGGKMILESRKESERLNPSFGPAAMLPLAVATSIDALAVGVSLAFLGTDITPVVVLIGSITFLLSALGVKIGHVFGAKYKSNAELVGGVILVLMGLKILLEHLGILQ